MYYWLVFAADDEVTVGKFYASYLIQEYFRRFRARQRAESADYQDEEPTQALQVRRCEGRNVPEGRAAHQSEVGRPLIILKRDRNATNFSESTDLVVKFRGYFL